MFILLNPQKYSLELSVFIDNEIAKMCGFASGFYLLPSNPLFSFQPPPQGGEFDCIFLGQFSKVHFYLILKPFIVFPTRPGISRSKYPDMDYSETF